MDQSSLPVESSTIEMPSWASELAGHYMSRTQSTFILHGNVRDLVRSTGAPEKTIAQTGSYNVAYLPFAEYLAKILFARRKYVLLYDISHGLRLADPAMNEPFTRLLKAMDTVSGSTFAVARPKDPHGVFLFLARLVRALSVKTDPEERRLAIIVDWAEMIFPRSDMTTLSLSDRAAEIAIDRFASSREVLEGDVTLALLTEDLTLLSQRIVNSAFTAPIRINMPGESERRDFASWTALTRAGDAKLTAESNVWRQEIDALTTISAGLTLTQIGQVLAEIDSGAYSSGSSEIDIKQAGWRGVVMKRKKTMIERECGGMLEFIGSKSLTLDLVAIHHLAVADLRKDVELFKAGESHAVPSGYLICGPSGSGKSFMVRCFAGEAGVPCVELRNFRDKWVGATEANLEKLLNVLSALAPVIVIVDEADAALGDRGGSDGDSGLSGRVFSRLISFMGDPRNRGRVVWMLITNRPDLLSIDLKRQGRAEKHIPLFPPQTVDDYEDLFKAYVKKHGLKLDFDTISAVCDASTLTLSGSDLESVMFRAFARSRARAAASISVGDMKGALDDFISPEYPDEIEYQTLLGVAESTSRALIPEKWRNDREKIAIKLAELKMSLPRG